jgi:predicted amidohydrolase YtcJ
MPCQPPTLILDHATVLTMDPTRPRAEAIALRQGRLVAVGGSAEVLALRQRSTRLIDCQGTVVLPGFIDAHLHVRAYAGTFLGIDCRPQTVHSLGELQEVLRQHSQHRSPGQWLMGYGYDDWGLVEKRHPTRWDLDVVTPNHPVRLAHRSRHAWVLNSLGLAELGITKEFTPPAGGWVEREAASGEPTGLLIEMDDYLRRHLPPLVPPERFRRGLQQGCQSLLAAGVTTVQDASVANDLAAYEAFRTWIADGDLCLRVMLLIGAAALPQVIGAGLQPGRGSPFLRVQGVKIRLDEGSGALHPPQEMLNAQVWSAHCRGFPVAIHAVELPALVSALHAIRLARARLPSSHLRHRIEHAALCPEVCIDELADLHVAVVTQPAFLWYHGRRYRSEIDPAQQPWLYRAKSLLARGVPVAGSSDAPVVPPLPLEGVYAAVTRRSSDGHVIGADERLSVEEALWMYTHGAAWACGLEAELGSIRRGKRADLVFLAADPTRVPVADIAHIPVCMTMVDGTVRWRGHTPTHELCHL